MAKKNLNTFAKLFVDHCLTIRKDDRILVLTDDGVNAADELGQMRDAVLTALTDAGWDPCVVCYPARRGRGHEIPALAEAACLASDILLSFNSSLLLYSRNFPKIHPVGESSRQVVLFPAGDSIRDEKDYFVRIMPDSEEEIFDVAARTKRYGELLGNGEAHSLHLTAENGTDLTFRLGTMGGSAHAGIASPGSFELIPAGILSLGVVEGSAEGTLVVDYSTTLKKVPLQNAIRFRIQDGYAVSVEGGTEAEDFIAAAAETKRPEREKYNIAEFGLGFNPRAKADGQVTDGENIVGAAHIGIGANSSFGGSVMLPEWHIDCILPRATVEADGRLLVKDGTYLF